MGLVNQTVSQARKNNVQMQSEDMRKLLSFIQSVSTGKVVLAFFIPAMIIYLIMLLYTIPQVAKYAPGMNLFDLSPTGYSFEYANELLCTLGSDGRDLYLYKQLPLDFIYPGLFAVSCSLLLSRLFLKSKNASSKIFYFCFVPVAAGLFDYLENICIVRILTSYPNISDISVSLASSMTIVKSGLTTAFFILLILGGALILIQKWKRKNQPNVGV